MNLVILDRDGVINKDSPNYIRSPAEWVPIPGSLEAIAALTKAGYTILITTNQSAIGRGYINLDTLEAIHAKMLDATDKLGGKIHKIYFCPHTPTEQCNCRKPKPGMFQQIEQDYKIKLHNIRATYIGDSLRDVEVGLATGCEFFLVIGPYGSGPETLQKITPEQQQKINIVEDLATAVEKILCTN